MIAKRGSVQIISVQKFEHDDLVRMIEKMDGVKVKRMRNGIKISIHGQSMPRASVGIVIKRKKRKGVKTGYLTPVSIMPKGQSSSTGYKQSSAIIAKQFG